MPLTGYVSLNANTTNAGAPIDSFLMRTLRLNDDLHDNVLSPLAQSFSLRNDASLNAIQNPGSGGFSAANIIQTNTFTVNAQINLTPGIPLIILATQSITISNLINGKGLSAPAGNFGQLGGGGGGGNGGGATAGGNTQMPFSNITLNAGGANTGGAGTSAPSNNSILRFISMLPMMLGGAPGGNGPAGPDIGGRGGGVVVLVAPTVVITGSGRVDVSGGNAAGNGAGGGGGGTILVMATVANISGYALANFTNTPAGGDLFDITGGNASGGGTPGGAGGNGMRLFLPLP
jgi:hypothetical protein